MQQTRNLPLWSRLPRELLQAVLLQTEIVAALVFGDGFTVGQLLKRDSAVADIETQRAWWAAALASGWLRGAQLLLDAYVSYLPTMQDDQQQPSIEMLELLLASDIIFAPNAAKAFRSVQDALDRLYELPWLLDNIDTLFALVQRLPVHSQRRLPMLKRIWTEVPATCRERLLPILTNRGDTGAIDKLGCTITPALQMHFLPLGQAGRKHGIQLLAWLQKKRPVNLEVFAMRAAERDNLPVLRWCCDQFSPDKEVPIVELASLADVHCSMEVLDHLVQEHQDTMAPHFLQSELLQQHYPTASDNISWSTSVKDMAALRWLQQHRQTSPAGCKRCEARSRQATSKVLTYFTEHYLDVLPQAGVLTIPSCIRQLAPSNTGMQDMSFYFAKSAIAANDFHWLRRVAVDFGATLSGFCSMKRLYALEQLPLLQQPFEEDGVALSQYAIDLAVANQS
ncbi:hypothetical protein RI367_002651 [Sorochytrium milnesiophthora]